MNQPSDANTSALFQTGGTLPVNAPTYVERDADDALYAAIQAREFCYVLNSRQMGKSSLRARIMGRLQAEGVACAAVDLSALGGQQVNDRQWYSGLIRKLVNGFELTQRFNLRSWLQDYADLPPVQQLGEFIESILLTQIAQPIVIFIDEIDSVLSLNFLTDDLFTFIRACYNQRVDDPAYGRLTFVLLGVATPADLVRDKSRTPFNVGRSIELSGLTFERSQPLIESLGLTVANPAEVLQTILAWSQGQPFLTQRLCRLVVEQRVGGATLSVEAINQLVQRRVIENWQTQDEQDHLRTIQDRVLQDKRKAGRRLGLYQQILQQGAVSYDGSPEQMELRLSGLVVTHRAKLEVYNQIYEQVFNTDWVNQSLAQLRPYAEAISAWLDSDRQDKSRLLRGQALLDAQIWALGKNLGTQDYEFLAASRELDLEVVKAALLTQEEANQILENAHRKAAQRLKLSAGGVALAIGLAAIAGLTAFQTQNELKIATASTRLEQTGLAALNQFEFDTVDSLLKALKTSRELNELNIQLHINPNNFSEYLAASPLLALNHMQNQLGSGRLLVRLDKPQKIRFTPDGRKVVVESNDGLSIWDLENGKSIHLDDYSGFNYTNGFSPDSSHLVGFSWDNAVKVWDLKNGESKLLGSHSSQIYSANFSHDSTRVVTTSSDGTAKVWNLKNGRSTSLEGHQGIVRSANFSPDGNQIVAVPGDGTVRVWNLTNNQSTILKGHKGLGLDAKFSPDGSRIMSVSKDGDVRVWNLRNSESAPLEGYWEKVRTASFSPDSDKLLITQEEGNTPSIWDLNSNKRTTLPENEQWTQNASFSPNSIQVVTISFGGIAKVWNLKSGQSILLKTEHSPIISAAFSPDSNKLFTISTDHTLRKWDLSSGESTLLDSYRGGKKNIETYPGEMYSFTAFNNDATKIISFLDIDAVWMWDVRDINLNYLESSKSWTGNSQSSTNLSPDNRFLAVRLKNNSIQLWDLKHGSYTLLEGHKGVVNSTEFSPDSSRIVTTSGDGTARVWDLDSGDFTLLEDHQGWGKIASFSPDGTKIVTVSSGGVLRVWDLKNGDSISLEKHQDEIDYLSFSSDSTKLVGMSKMGTARVWDLGNGSSMFLEELSNGIISASFVPNSNKLLAILINGTAQLWDLETGKFTLLEDNQKVTNSIGFSPDGTYVATAYSDGTVRVWNLNSRRSVLLEGHRGIVNSASFSPDVTYVVTTSFDGTARVWDLNSRRSVLLESYPNSVNTARFSPDGTYVVTSSSDLSDSIVRVWDLNGRQIATYRGSLNTLSSDGKHIFISEDKGIDIYSIKTLPELLEWGCQRVYNYLEHGSATDEDRSICNLPPRIPKEN